MGKVMENFLFKTLVASVLIFGGTTSVWGADDIWLLYVDPKIFQESSPNRAAAEALSLLPEKVAAASLTTMSVRDSANLLAAIPAEKASKILAEMKGKNIAHVLRVLSTKSFAEVPRKSAEYFGYFRVGQDKAAEICQIFQTLVPSLLQRNNTKTYILDQCREVDSGAIAGLEPKLGKPVVNEKNNTYVLYVFEKSSTALACNKKLTAHTGVDARIAPTTPAPKGPEAISLREAQTGDEDEKTLYFFLCDLSTQEMGGNRVTYTVGTPGDWDTGTGQPKIKDPIVQGVITTHALYRFRITGGPLWSSLIRKNKTFNVQTNSSGQMFINSSERNDSPVNYGLFLKTYLEPDGRDILINRCELEKVITFDCLSVLDRLSFLVGVNLVDNPAENFYVGVGLEPTLGIDIIAGAHIAKIRGLAGGFREGQSVSSTEIATREVFQVGYFAGVTVDVGVIGAWIGNGIFGIIRGGFGAPSP